MPVVEIKMWTKTTIRDIDMEEFLLDEIIGSIQEVVEYEGEEISWDHIEATVS